MLADSPSYKFKTSTQRLKRPCDSIGGKFRFWHSHHTLPAAVFFDRDGCLNRDTGYVHRWQDFDWLPGAVEAVRAVNRAGFLAFVVTNQSGIARGYYNAAAVEQLHRCMAAALARRGAWIAGFRYCPHHPDFPQDRPHGPCACRKPNGGMITDLMKAWRIDPSRSLMVGDRDSDVAAARAAGIAGIKVPPGRLLPAVRRHLNQMA